MSESYRKDIKEINDVKKAVFNLSLVNQKVADSMTYFFLLSKAECISKLESEANNFREVGTGECGLICSSIEDLANAVKGVSDKIWEDLNRMAYITIGEKTLETEKIGHRQ